jgi:hypothetical protein
MADLIKKSISMEKLMETICPYSGFSNAQMEAMCKGELEEGRNFEISFYQYRITVPKESIAAYFETHESVQDFLDNNKTILQAPAEVSSVFEDIVEGRSKPEPVKGERGQGGKAPAIKI